MSMFSHPHRKTIEKCAHMIFFNIVELAIKWREAKKKKKKKKKRNSLDWFWSVKRTKTNITKLKKKKKKKIYTNINFALEKKNKGATQLVPFPSHYKARLSCKKIALGISILIFFYFVVLVTKTKFWVRGLILIECLSSRFLLNFQPQPDVQFSTLFFSRFKVNWNRLFVHIHLPCRCMHIRTLQKKVHPMVPLVEKQTEIHRGKNREHPSSVLFVRADPAIVIKNNYFHNFDFGFILLAIRPKNVIINQV